MAVIGFAFLFFTTPLFDPFIGKVNPPAPLPLTQEPDPATKAKVSAQMMRLPLSFEVNNGQTDPQVKFLSRGGNHSVFFTPDKIVMGFSARKADANDKDNRLTPSREGAKDRPEAGSKSRDSASLSRKQENAPVASAGQERKFSSNNHPHLEPLPEGEEAHPERVRGTVERLPGQSNPPLPHAGALTERRGRGEGGPSLRPSRLGGEKILTAYEPQSRKENSADAEIQRNVIPAQAGIQGLGSRWSLPSTPIGGGNDEGKNIAPLATNEHGNDEEKGSSTARHGEWLELHPVGANPNPEIIGESELPHKSNYFKGNDPAKWHSNVANYAKVRYKEVYPGIDLVFYGNQGQMEFDFVVSPGADPNVIRMAVSEQAKLTLDPANGDLKMQVGESTVVFHAPVIYQCSPHGQCRDSASLSREQENAPVALAGQVGKSSSNNHPHLDPLPEGEEAHPERVRGTVERRSGQSNPSLPHAGALTERRGRGEGGPSLRGAPAMIQKNVIPAQAGIHELDSRFHGNDEGKNIAPLAASERGNGENENRLAPSRKDAKNLKEESPPAPLYEEGRRPEAGSKSRDSAQVRDLTPVAETKKTVFARSDSDEAIQKNTSWIAAPPAAARDDDDEERNRLSPNRQDAKGNKESGFLGGFASLRDAKVVEGRFALLRDGKGFAFRLGDYDKTQPLIIDPSLTFSTYLGGSNSDTGYGIAVDSSGNVYVTGDTYSSDFPTTSGAYDTTLGGTRDAFVTKLNSSGSALTFSTYLGGSNVDYGYAIAVDSSGNVYVTGSTQSSDFPTASAYDTTCGGCTTNSDAFVTKLNSSGSALTFSTYLGGSNYDYGYGIAVDSSGNVYVTGDTYSSDFPTTSGTYDSSLGGSIDAFVAKLNSSGTALTFSTYLGGSSSEYGRAIALDSSGNAYVTGYTQSSDFPTASAYDTTLGGSQDVFVTKLNSSGSALTFSTYLGGSSSDASYGIAVDSSGNVYVTGYTQSSNFPTTSGAYDSSLGGSIDAFVTKLNSSGTALTFSTYLGGSSSEYGRAIALDSSGNAYVTGQTFSSDFPTTSGAYQTTCGGCTSSSDAFVTKLNSTGSALAFSTYLGGSNYDYGYGIALDSSGNAYVTGYTLSSDFPTASAYDSTLGSTSLEDAFVTKFDMSDLNPSSSSSSSSSISTVPKVISPYWEAQAAIYTLIAVSHPSLSGMNSNIGILITAMSSDASSAGSVSFTISAKATQRVFIVTTNASHSIRSGTPSDARFITVGTSEASRGSLVITPVATSPYNCAASSAGGVIGHCGYRDVTTLSYWGAIVISGTATGFAMEFVGDLHDSIDTGSNLIQGSGQGGFAQGGVGLN